MPNCFTGTLPLMQMYRTYFSECRLLTCSLLQGRNYLLLTIHFIFGSLLLLLIKRAFILISTRIIVIYEKTDLVLQKIVFII